MLMLTTFSESLACLLSCVILNIQTSCLKPIHFFPRPSGLPSCPIVSCPCYFFSPSWRSWLQPPLTPLDRSPYLHISSCIYSLCWAQPLTCLLTVATFLLPFQPLSLPTAPLDLVAQVRSTHESLQAWSPIAQVPPPSSLPSVFPLLPIFLTAARYFSKEQNWYYLLLKNSWRVLIFCAIKS